MTSWHQLVVGGSDAALRAFVAAMENSAGGAATFVFGRDLDLAAEGLGKWLLDLLEGGRHQQVFAPAAAIDLLSEALARRGDDAGLHVHSRSTVESASFGFSTRAYSEEISRSIREALVVDLPQGVRVSDLEEATERNPEAHGAELYAPEHEFTYSASGTISGPFPGVLEAHRRARESEFVDADPISISTSPID